MSKVHKIHVAPWCKPICTKVKDGSSKVFLYLYENSENGLDKERESGEFMEGWMEWIWFKVWMCLDGERMMKKENEEGGWKNHSSGISVMHKVVKTQFNVCVFIRKCIAHK